MSEPIEGGCRCGAIRYRVKTGKLPNVYACHCRDCQTWSGSAFSLQFVVPEDALEIVSGTPALYERFTAESGRTSYQRGCPICFTRIYNTNSARPGLAVGRAGTLDRSDELNIVAHIWTKRKLNGIDIPQGVASWPEGAPPAEFAAVLMR
ncbi:MAG TPA: GFA family protein [Rhizomicrobium sp.]|nr:GFA family protein [Rhizomicrobium sp.]